MIKKDNLLCLSLYWGLFIVVLGFINFISKNAQAEQQFNVANNGTVVASVTNTTNWTNYIVEIDRRSMLKYDDTINLMRYKNQ